MEHGGAAGGAPLSEPGAGGRAPWRADLIAGLSVAVVLVPQAIAYAYLAGLPAVYGLRAALAGTLVYGLLGGTGPLAVGPAALDALLVAAVLAGVGSGEPATVAALTLLVGAIQVAVALVGGAAAIANFLARPVVGGFLAGAAVLIFLNQVGPLLGLELAGHRDLVSWLAAWRGGAPHLPTTLLGLGSLLALAWLRRRLRRLPAILPVAAAALLAVALLDLEARGVAVVGAFAALGAGGSWPVLAPARLAELLPGALALAFVGGLETLSLVAAFAGRGVPTGGPGRELVAVGAANLAGAFGGGFPVAGGPSRSGLAERFGARSPRASLFAGVGVLLLATVGRPLLVHLPRAFLAAVIVVGASGLIRPAEVRLYATVKRRDLLLYLAAAGATLLLGPIRGLLVGAGLSLLAFLIRSVRPHYAILGRLPGTRFYRNVRRFPEAELLPGVGIVRFDASLYFANTGWFRRALAELERTLEAAGKGPLRAVVVDAASINDLDTSGALELVALAEELARRGVLLRLAGVKGPVRDVLAACGFTERVGSEAFSFDVHEAVERLAPRLGFPCPEVTAVNPWCAAEPRPPR